MANSTTFFNSTTTTDWSLEVTITASVNFLLLGISTILHSLGIVLQLYGVKPHEITNQAILLVHFSIVSLLNTAINGCAVYYKTYKMRYPKDYISSYNVGYLAYIINLILITIDRVLFVLLNLHYRKYVKRYAVYVALSILWLASIIYGLLLRYVKFNRVKYFEYAHHVYNGFTCCFAAFCYILIFSKVIISSRGFNKNRSESIKSMKKFFVPFMIVMTFFLFQYLPSILSNHFKVDKDFYQVYILILIGVNILNLVSDPLLYIFLQPKTRKNFWKLCRKFRLTKNQRQIGAYLPTTTGVEMRLSTQNNKT